MSYEAAIAILKAHLAKEGLVLCKANDTQFALDGLKECEALRQIVELVEDTGAVNEWGSDISLANTTPVHQDLLAALAKAS